jgi:putative nucleotidyltransferase with HDIG domain
MEPLTFSERLGLIRDTLPGNTPVFLVGGAVRDALLRRTTHDLDFVLAGDALAVARRVANALSGAYYPLDADRQIGRVVLSLPDGTRETLDFSRMRATDLEGDLRLRDFTIDAMAIDIKEPQALLDPLGGASDLRAKQLRACAPSAFSDDPVRILRSVRLAAEFGFHIERETLKSIRQATGDLQFVSAERKRDELFRLLDGPQVVSAIRALDMIAGLGTLLPELGALKGIKQSPPHVADVWMHTLDVLRHLEGVLNILSSQFDPEASGIGLYLGLISLILGRYRGQLDAHLGEPMTPERSLRPLLFLAALYHDVAKPQTQMVDEQGKIRFFDHEVQGASVVEKRAAALSLSHQETERLSVIVRHHMRPHHLSNSEHPLTRRSIYRFFRDTGSAGVDICLLSLADVLATYGPTLPQEVWQRQLDTVRTLLEAWWEHPQQSISPPVLLNGNELINTFNLSQGRMIGQILEAIREAQATGQVPDRDEALKFARAWLDEHGVTQG